MVGGQVSHRRTGQALLVALVGIAGCAEPFSVERHVLGPPRLAALGVVDGEARAAVWSGDGPWHAAAPTLSWALDGQPLGEGYGVSVPDGDVLSVSVTMPDGQTLVGEGTVGTDPGLDVVRQVVPEPEDLSLDARLAVTEPSPRATDAEAGELVRVTATRRDGNEGTLRWMLGSSAWSVLELQADTADVVAAKVTFDDGQIDGVQGGPAGLAPLLVLSVDGAGNNSWRWLDVGFAVDDILLPVQGRLLPISPDTATDAVLQESDRLLTHVVATLEADPQAEAGIRLVDVEAGTQLDADLLAHPSPACAPPGLGFPLWTLPEGRCPVPEIDGSRVVLELR